MNHEAPRYLDAIAWHAHKVRTGEELHVFLDGEDVTSRSFRVIFHHNSNTIGDVWLYLLNAAGERFLDPATNKPAQETRTGHVRIAPGAPF